MGILGEFAAAFRAQFGDPSFALGFFEGMFLALVIGYASSRVLYWWNRMLQPTRMPAAQSGPRPVDNLLGCAGAVGVLVLLAVFAGYLLLAG